MIRWLAAQPLVQELALMGSLWLVAVGVIVWCEVILYWIHHAKRRRRRRSGWIRIRWLKRGLR